MRGSIVALVALSVLGSGCSGSVETTEAASTPAVVDSTTSTTSTSVAPAPSSTTSPVTVSTTTTTIAISTTATDAPTTTAPADTTTTSPPATTRPAPCAAEPTVPLPGGAVVVSSAGGDLDGDGLDDRVDVYRAGDEYGVHLALAHGWETGRSLTDLRAQDTSAPSVRGIRDLGDALALVELDGTLIGPRFALFGLVDCRLAPISLAEGGLPELVFGGGLMHTWWFSCVSNVVTQVSVTRTGDNAELPETLTQWVYRYDTGTRRFSQVTEAERDVTSSSWDELLAEFPPCTES